MLKNILLVGLGGSIGAMLRYIITLLLKVQNFPYQTLLVNIIGSLVIGLVFGLSAKNHNFPESLKLFLATGICGGFTTFSAFSIENMNMLKQGNYLLAILYIFASITLCIIAVFAGFKLIN
ncbi:MAG: fluoride efflux transporter CrcB [Ferruginibacter sp.]|nr:fluoride efflux transporter CrcB [Ferruginibacter sp.]